MTTPPTAVLYGHRLGARATGIARYIDELTLAVQAAPQTDIAYALGGSREAPDAVVAAESLPLHRVPLPREPLHAAWTLFGLPRVDRWIGRPDLIHVLYPSAPVPATAPTVITVHDLMPLLNPTWHTRKERAMFAAAMRHARRHAAAFIANSHKTEQELVDHLGIAAERITVVHLGTTRAFAEPVDRALIDAVTTSLNVAPGQYLLVLGTVSIRKDPMTAVRAFAHSTVAAEQGMRLVLAGPMGDAEATVRSLIAELGLGDRVVLAGWRTADDVRALVAGARLFVHPSSDEGFGMPPLEAMAAGVPVVATAAGSLPEVVGDAALVAAVGDDDSWTEALDRALADEALRAELVAKGQARAAHFTWERAASETIAVHRRVLGLS